MPELATGFVGFLGRTRQQSESKSPPPKPTCENCVYCHTEYSGDLRVEVSDCRAHPPISKGIKFAEWPRIMPSDFCGEWVGKIKEEKPGFDL